ncbi:protein-tyrosine phosphatase-like protein [Baffinella frigidus]|nr:protein-tyrosine phosphatase-like protein [Cryptophyta sp. CCMP2293]
MAQARIYGFQWALVDGSRLFDLFDVVIVVMSIAFYILALTGTSLPPTPSFEASPLGPAHQSPRLVASEAGQPAATACLPFGCTFPPTHVRTHTQHGGFSHPSLLARAIAVDGWPGVTLAQARWVIFARLLRMIKAINIARSLRKLVGSNKRRYQKDGFDLDLTYVTPSCIAMSLPAEGGEANYRNSLVDVCRFFHTKHPEMFYIYNLCAERSYDAAHFSGRVKRFMCDDHNPPLLSDLVSFVEHGNRFMDESDNHVMGVHCLGGKGRTGVFVCAWLMYSTFSASAQAALVHFAAKRTGHGGKTVQGVSGASQRRYLHYFQRVLENGGYRTSRLVLNKIVMITCPKMDPDGGCDPWFTIEQNGVFIYNSKVSLGVTNMKKNTAFIEFEHAGSKQAQQPVEEAHHRAAVRVSGICGAMQCTRDAIACASCSGCRMPSASGGSEGIKVFQMERRLMAW